jgi:hypothetical protein
MDDENVIIFDPLGELQRLAEELEKIKENKNHGLQA